MNDICAFEKKFLKTIISNFKQLLMYKDKGYFDNIQYSFEYKAKASAVEKVKLSKVGTMMYIYSMAYKEPFPECPNTIEQTRINEIWLAMNMPENIIPT
jgi:hypothetical protein